MTPVTLLKTRVIPISIRTKVNWDFRKANDKNIFASSTVVECNDDQARVTTREMSSSYLLPVGKATTTDMCSNVTACLDSRCYDNIIITELPQDMPKSFQSTFGLLPS